MEAQRHVPVTLPIEGEHFYSINGGPSQFGPLVLTFAEAGIHTVAIGDTFFYVEVIDIRDARAIRSAHIKQARDVAFETTPTRFGVFDSDKDGRDNVKGMLDAWRVMEPAPASIDWRVHDNSFVTLTLAELQEVGVMMVQHRSAVYATCWSLEAAISSASTLAELRAIEWPS